MSKTTLCYSSLADIPDLAELQSAIIDPRVLRTKSRWIDIDFNTSSHAKFEFDVESDDEAYLVELQLRFGGSS